MHVWLEIKCMLNKTFNNFVKDGIDSPKFPTYVKKVKLIALEEQKWR